MKKTMIYTCATFYDCIDAAAAKAASFGNSLKERTVIFCEDKLSLSVELALAEKTGGSFNVEVCSFGRYIQKNAAPTSVLSKEGGAMAVKKILSSTGDLIALKNSASPSLAAQLCELIAQLKSAKVSPDDLERCIPDCPENVAAKLHDIAAVFRGYENFLKDNDLTDSNNSLRDMPALLEKDEKIKNAHVIVAGFSSVTKQSCDVVKTLMKTSLTCDFFCVTGENHEVYTDEFYNFVRQAENSVQATTSLACSEAIRLVSCLYEPSCFAKEGLYSDKIAIYEAQNSYDEMGYIANRIRYEVLENGIRYRDVAIGVGNLPEYSLTLKRRLRDFEIPFFTDEKRKLSDHPSMKLITAALKSAERGGDMREIRKIISNSVFIPEKELADSMLKEITEKSVTAKTFLDTDIQLFCDNCYLSAKREAIRRLNSNLKRKDTARGFINATRNFLSDAGAEDNVKSLSEKLGKIGAEEEKAFNDSAFGKLDGVLKETENILGDETLTLSEFVKILNSGAEACEISLIPEYSDCVFVSELKDCRFRKYKILFAAGLGGDVPSVRSDTALLQDGDIGKLDKLSVRVEPKIRVVNKREREAVALALTSFTDKLYLSYSVSAPSGARAAKSEIIDYVIAAFSDSERQLKPFGRISIETARRYAEGERKDRMDAYDYTGIRPALFSLVKDGDDFKNGATSDVDAASSFYSALRKFQDGKYLPLADELLGNVNKKLLVTCDVPPENYFADGNVSASVLETYYSCPYKNFLKYGVGLADTLTPDVRSLDFGNVLHAVAENFVKRIDEVKDEDEAKALAAEIYEEIISEEKYSRFMQRSDYAYSATLIKDESVKLCSSLYREFQNSLFRPSGEEVWFADWGEYKAYPLKTKKKGYKLFGKADRLDRYGDYVRIIDYKTGNVENKIKDEKFYVGVNLQLYLYMNAFIANGLKPAGAYYYPINDDYRAPDDKRYSMYGKTLDEKEIINATDTAFYKNKTSSVINASVQTLKSGEKTTGNFADRRTLEGYLDYAKLMATEGVNDVTDGVIAATPYEGACDYCEYKALCRYDEEYDDRTRKAKGVKPETIVSAAEAENDRKR